MKFSKTVLLFLLLLVGCAQPSVVSPKFEVVKPVLAEVNNAVCDQYVNVTLNLSKCLNSFVAKTQRRITINDELNHCFLQSKNVNETNRCLLTWNAKTLNLDQTPLCQNQQLRFRQMTDEEIEVLYNRIKDKK